jgi:hypothetical protein
VIVGKRPWRGRFLYLALILAIGILRYGSAAVAVYFDLPDLTALSVAGLATLVVWFLLWQVYRRLPSALTESADKAKLPDA